MGTAPIFCTQCGRPSSGSERFCAGCGTALSSPSPTGSQTAVTGHTAGTESHTAATGVTGLPAHVIGDSDSATTGLFDPAATVIADPAQQAAYARAHIDQKAAALFTPGRQIGSRYTIIKMLGRGGMGAVYQAWDDELMVAVAIKVILPDASGDPHTRHDVEQRFKRELLLARQVSHRNVVRIHDIGDVDGVKYITMSFVEGETLAALLQREKTLTVPQALSLTRQIAEGLAAAHEVGIIHRDLKPENIMITPDGHAVIMDFGIARSAAKGGTHTQAGTILGTLEYMAPEQARAQSLDQRVDVYALGLILYDMLVGRRTRMKGLDTPTAEMMARLQHAPPPARSINADVPEPTDELVQRCLQPEPEARFENAQALLNAIAQLTADGYRPAHVHEHVDARPAKSSRLVLTAAGAATAVAIGVASFALWSRTPLVTVVDPVTPVSVLVADFENRTGDPVFDGVLEQALTLGVEGASFVVPYARNAALRDAARIRPGTTRLDEATARLVALSAGLNAVIVGTVEGSGNEYRLVARVVEPGDAGRVLASAESEAGSKGDVLQAVGGLAGEVREALGDKTVAAGSRLNESFTAGSLEAARAYVLAQESQFAGKRDEAIAKYEEAIRLDPEFGRAYSGLAAQYANMGRREDAEKYYQLALARIDRMTDRERYRTRGSYFLFARKPELALEQYTELLKAFPFDEVGLTNVALSRFLQRDFAAALDLGRKSAANQPNNSTRRSNVALYAMYGGQFDVAIEEAQHANRLNPAAARPYVAQALSHLASGRPAEARALYEKVASVSAEGASFAPTGLADLALYEGRVGDAIKLLETGIAQELATKSIALAAAKRAMLAEARLLRGETASAIKEAQTAAAAVEADDVRLVAGLVLARAARNADAEAIAAKLDTRLESDPRAYAVLIRAEIALAQGNARAAVEHSRAAATIANTWLGQVTLGRAYLAANAFTEAYAQLEAALKRRGEATAVFLDDRPTYHLLPPVHYYMALAQEGLKSPGAAASLKTFLAIKQNGDEQGLVADARRRLDAAR